MTADEKNEILAMMFKELAIASEEAGWHPFAKQIQDHAKRFAPKPKPRFVATGFVITDTKTGHNYPQWEDHVNPAIVDLLNEGKAR